MTLQPRWTHSAMVGLVVVAVFLAHGGALWNGFLYDDFHLIVENQAVANQAWIEVWTSASASSREAVGRGFRPVTLSSYIVDRAVGGGPALFHATQVGLHVAVAGLVYLVATSFGLAPCWRMASAILVALHPLQTEAVQYLSARSSALSTVGLLAAFWTYQVWRSRPEGARLWRAASLCLLALATLSKESAVIGLVWFVAYERLVRTASWAEGIRRLRWHAATAVASVLPAAIVFGSGASGASVSTDRALATGVLVVGRTLWAWIAPWTVEPVTPQAWVGWSEPNVWGATVLVAMVSGLGYVVRRTIPLVGWGVAAAISTLLPVLSLPFVTNVALFQPHRGYQASVGLALASAAAAEAVWRRIMRTRAGAARRVFRTTAWVGAGAAVVVLVIVDARAGRMWRDEVTFWSAAVERYPREAGYHQSLGVARLRSGDPERAVDALEAAARLSPALPRVDFNLGLAYSRLGRGADAVAAYERAAINDPSDVKALANLGVLYERVGAAERAAWAYGEALSIDPDLIAVRERLEQLERRLTVDAERRPLSRVDR